MWRPFPPSPPKYLLFCFKLYQRRYTLLRHSVLLACVCLLLVWDILVLTTNHYNVRTSATATVHPCVHTIIKAVPLFTSNWTTAVPYHVFEWQNMPRGLLVLKCLLHLVTRMWGWCLESGTWFSCRTCNKLWTKYEGKKTVSLNVGIKVFAWENPLSECQSYPSAKTIVAPSQDGNKGLPIFEMCRSVRKNINSYEIKTSYHENCLSDFFSLVVMHPSLVRCANSFVFLMHHNSRIKIVQAHLPLNNLYDLKEEEWGKGVDNLFVSHTYMCNYIRWGLQWINPFTKIPT